MYVIGFLCVSLGSSTIQLHDSLGSGSACACSEADFSSQIVTVLEECTTEDERSVVRFYGPKDTLQRIFVKKCLRWEVFVA
jgi:hypothetical protein